MTRILRPISPFHCSYDVQSAVDVVLRYGVDGATLNDEDTLALSGLALGWILTSSSRAQRDSDTKGLVRLLILGDLRHHPTISGQA